MPLTHSRARLHADHTPHAIRQRLAIGPAHSYVRDFVYGATDGVVTTFAAVAAVVGAQLGSGAVIILGLANLLADGFSMAVSNFLATRTEEQVRRQARRIEEAHIAAVPEGEREEIRQIFAAKGFTGEDLERAVQIITSDMERWVDTMLTDELGLALTGASPWRAAATTFAAFVVVGALPLLAYVYELTWSGILRDPFIVSAALTAAAFFVVGAFKGRLVSERWWWSGLETLAIGSVAATIAFLVGVMLKQMK